MSSTNSTPTHFPSASALRRLGGSAADIVPRSGKLRSASSADRQTSPDTRVCHTPCVACPRHDAGGKADEGVEYVGERWKKPNLSTSPLAMVVECVPEESLSGGKGNPLTLAALVLAHVSGGASPPSTAIFRRHTERISQRERRRGGRYDEV